MEKRINALMIACAVLMTAAQVHAAAFTVGSTAGTATGVDPGLRSFATQPLTPLPANFNLTNPGDNFTFDAIRFYTDETSATEPDDPNLLPASVTLNFTVPGVKAVTINGNTHGGLIGAPLPIIGSPGPAGIVEWNGPVFFSIGVYNLKAEATDTIYNDPLTSNTSGPNFGGDVPVTITLVSIEDVPEPATLALLGMGGLVMIRRRGNR